MNISLVIPFYNDYPLLGSALQSVYRQSLIPNEKILVYNGSHLEDAEKLIKQLLEIYKPLNMRLITAGPVGLPAARNIGIQNSSSEYICFLDVDDAMSFNRIQKQYEFLRNNAHIDAVSSWYTMFQDESGCVKLPEKHSSIKFSCIYWQSFFVSGSMMKRSIFNDSQNLFNTSLGIAEDCDWLIRMICKGLVFNNILEPLTSYRIHQNSLSHRDPSLTKQQSIRVKRNALKLDSSKLSENNYNHPVNYSELFLLRKMYPEIFNCRYSMSLYWQYSQWYNFLHFRQANSRLSFLHKALILLKLILASLRAALFVRCDYFLPLAFIKLAYSQLVK